jgi:hypothetical protein
MGKLRLALIAPGPNHTPVLTRSGQILLFAVAVALIILRRPDAILNPQFWAEDGVLWYADPYNVGIIRSLTGAIAQFLPLTAAPLLFNTVAIVIQALPVTVFLSSRFADRFPALWARSAFAFVYLALPNSSEVHANLTNAKWHLALLAFLVVLARPAASLGWRVFDVGVVMLCSVSGPFALFLVPILAFGYRHSLRSWRGLLIGLLAVGALVQGLSLMTQGGEVRSTVPLGASFEGFVRIVSGQVFLAGAVGRWGYSELLSLPGFGYLAMAVFVLGSMAFAWALVQGPLELRLLVFFASLILASALIAPMASLNPEDRQWHVLTSPGAVGRYWLFPMLAFICVILWAAGQGAKSKAGSVAARAAQLALLAILVGMVLDWRQPRYTDFSFSDWAHRVEEAAVGEKVKIPINPGGWTFTLTKRERLRW